MRFFLAVRGCVALVHASESAILWVHSDIVQRPKYMSGKKGSSGFRFYNQSRKRLPSDLSRWLCYTKGRVALERIQVFPIFSEEKNWQKFRKFQILAVVALDQHVGTKTLPIEIYVTRSIFLH